jgi:hypothetical protein
VQKKLLHTKKLRNLPPPPPFRGEFRAAIDFGWGRRIDFQSDPHLRTLEVPPPGGAASWSDRKKSGRGENRLVDAARTADHRSLADVGKELVHNARMLEMVT